MEGLGDDRLQLLVPVRTRDGEVWITQHAVDRFAERHAAGSRNVGAGPRELVGRLRAAMKGGRIRESSPLAGFADDEDGYLVTGAFVWPLRRQDESWIALTTIDR